MTYYNFKLLILAWSEAPQKDKFPSAWLNVLFDWQTLIAAVVAGLPAALGAYFLWRQIRIQQKENARATRKEEMSARIRLASALASLTQHYKACIGPVLSGKYEIHAIPTSSLETLMAAAPTVDKHIFEHIQRLILNFQVFSSRYPSKTGTLMRDMQELLLYDIAKLHHATNALYPFARFEDGQIPIVPFTAELMYETLNTLIATSDYAENKATDNSTIKRAVTKAFPPKTTREIPLDAD